jgi:iron complex outermembrane receptor protein
MRFDRTTLLLLGGTALCAPAWAETPGPAQVAAPPGPQPSPAQAAVTAQAPAQPTLEEIVVTAKKRRQNLQNVPQTVDVVRGSDVRKLDLFQFDELQNVVAGLGLNENGGRGQNISLRGITFDPDTAADPAVDVYLNEVPLAQVTSIFQDMYDLDTVQVVRGPQGTLRGRTSPAGAILVDTMLPDLDRTSGYAEVTFSDNDRLESQFGVGTPLVPGKLAVRIAGLFDQNGGYGTQNIVTGQSDHNLQHSYRITLEARPNDSFDLVLMHQESNDRTRQFPVLDGDGTAGPISPEQNLSAVSGPYEYYDRSNLTTLQARLHIPQGDIVYVSGYQAVKDEFARYQDVGDMLPHFDTGSQLSDQSVNEFTQELRFQSPANARLATMLGVYFAHQDATADVFTPSEILFDPAPYGPYPYAKPVANINADVGIPELETDYAVFTDETFRIGPRDTVEGGLRWQYVHQYRASGYTVDLPPELGGGTLRQTLIDPNNQNADYRAWTGLASYTHQASEHISLYASYGQSFRPGGAVLGVSVPLPEQFLIFKPETSYDFEIGTKARWLDGRFRLDADIFHQTYSGYIGRENNLYTAYGYTSIDTNGDAVSQGFEFTATALITDNWHFALNATFADAHYDNARLPCNDFAGTGTPNVNGPPRVAGGGVVSYCVTDGTLGLPNWSVSLNSEYTVHIADGLEGFLRGLYTFQPRTRLTLQATNEDPRSIANLYVGLRRPDGRWEGLLFIKNAFNTTGFTDAFGPEYDSGLLRPEFAAVNFPTGYSAGTIVHPREIGATLSYRF